MIADQFHDYQGNGVQPTWMRSCSPALTRLLQDMERRWPAVVSLGCYGPRPIRGGSSPSTHSFGAAIDVGYGALGHPDLRHDMIGYLIAWSQEWGIQAVHDYLGCRIWRAGRTPNSADACSQWWKAQRRSSEGMGQSWALWLHVEVHPDRWFDSATASERGIL